MRIMAVDYGDARTGVAVSDVSGTLAGEAWVIHNKNPDIIAQVISEEAFSRDVTTIVVGYPRNMNGTIGPRAEKSEWFSKLLRSKYDGSDGDIEVVLWDERMTTLSAHRILTDTGNHGKKRKKNVDAVAACLILESYLPYYGSTEQNPSNT